MRILTTSVESSIEANEGLHPFQPSIADGLVAPPIAFALLPGNTHLHPPLEAKPVPEPKVYAFTNPSQHQSVSKTPTPESKERDGAIYLYFLFFSSIIPRFI